MKDRAFVGSCTTERISSYSVPEKVHPKQRKMNYQNIFKFLSRELTRAGNFGPLFFVVDFCLFTNSLMCALSTVNFAITYNTPKRSMKLNLSEARRKSTIVLKLEKSSRFPSISVYSRNNCDSEVGSLELLLNPTRISIEFLCSALNDIL